MTALARSSSSSTYTNPQLADGYNLVLGSRRVLDTKTDWPTARRSNITFESLHMTLICEAGSFKCLNLGGRSLLISSSFAIWSSKSEDVNTEAGEI
jgi:hypothetical protein